MINEIMPERIVLEETPSASDSMMTPSASQKLNITEIFKVYFNQSSGNRDDFQNSLTAIIESRKSEINNSPTNQKLTEALNNIKEHDLSLKSRNLGTSKAVKDSINKTLQCYKNYFLTKFSDDGTHENCDPDVKNILSNFNDTSKDPNDRTPNLLKSLTVHESDKQALEELSRVLNNYLAGLVIETESKINNNDNLADQKDNADKIKNILGVFPGGVINGMNQVQFACIGGSAERVEEAISVLNDPSPEVKSMQSAIDIFSAQIASKVEEGSQIHIKPCARGALMLDTSEVAKKDTHYVSPQKDITLRIILEFIYNLANQVKKEINEPIENLNKIIIKYEALKEEEPIDYSKINEFTKQAKRLGFNITIYDILAEDANGNKYESNIDDGSVEKKSHLIDSDVLKDKYSTTIPSEKFQQELSKIQKPEFDYLKHFLDPKKLFKDSSESGDKPSNRLDVKKIKNLVDLFPAKGDSQLDEEAKNAQKSKMLAGLVILRNILDGYKTSDNNYFYFLKFDKKFKEKTGESFEDFFYTKENSSNRFSNFFGKKNESRKIKDEFIQEKPILDRIIRRINYKEQSLYKNLGRQNSAILKRRVLKKLFSIEELVTEEKKVKKIKKLLTPTTLFSSSRVFPYNILNIKNGSGENLAEILYQFSEEIFEIAFDSEPKFLNKIMVRGSENTSLLQKIALKNDKELLLKILRKYQETHIGVDDISGSKALSDIIFKHNLVYHIASANNADLLKTIIPMLGSQAKTDFAKTYADLKHTILIQACSKGHTAIVQTLIDAGADLTQGDKDEATPLHFACDNGNIEIVKALIQGVDGNKADVNKARTTDGATPLHFACKKNGNIEIVKALIDEGANLDQAKNDGVTPLYVACKSGDIEIVKALIDKGANLDQAKNDGMTPLYVACESGNIEIVKALIDKGANLDHATNDGMTPLHVACRNGYIKIVKALIAGGPDGNKADANKVRKLDGATPLHVACENGNIEIVEALIAGGSDGNKVDVNKMNKYGETPLYLACQNPKGEPPPYLGQTRKIKIVKALIERGADVNKARTINGESTGETPLLRACIHGQLKSVQDLINAKADLNIARATDGVTPLHLACSNGYTDIFRALIAGGPDGNKADLEACATNGKTTLHFACASGNIEIVQALIKADHDGNKADVNKESDDGTTPLHVACQNCHIEIVKALIKERADVNKDRKPDGATPLYVACQTSYLPVVEELIKARANLNLALKNGETPLYSACKRGFTEVAKALFKAGADVDCLKRDGVVYGYLYKKDLENAPEEMKKLIKEFINPAKIKERDNKLANADDVYVGVVFTGQEAGRMGGGRS